MYLQGQAGQRGYAMAALLVTMSVMAILMTALLPVWRQQAQREKEAELAFRGEQYARAIYLFRTRNNNQSPPNMDVLVQGKYLRKKYKDPITADDFQPIFGGQQPQQPGPQGRGGSAQGRGGAPTPIGVGRGSGSGTQGRGIAQGSTGLFTVQSKSKEASIRIYNNAAHYNEWRFLYNARGRGGLTDDAPQPGPPGVGSGRGGPGSGRGAPGSGPGGRGTSGPGGRPPGGRGIGPGDAG